MSVYKDLELMTQMSIHQAKEHNCNYNVILMNPDENGEFSQERGSTYEMVADSYFQKDRPNVKLIARTDDLIAQEEVEEWTHGSDITANPFDRTFNINAGDRFMDPIVLTNPYKDHMMYQNLNHTPYVREERKIGNNEPCSCGSGKKYKKCCK